MNIFDKIMETYPDLNISFFDDHLIEIKDDGDGIQYLSKWDCELSIPKGLKLGKPSA